MSRYVKNLITEHLRSQLGGVSDALLVNVVGLKANAISLLRNELSAKQINLLVVKNSLAARACEGGPLNGLFGGVDGSVAVCWGGEDIVTLAKEVTRLVKDPRFGGKFEARGGMIDGEALSSEGVVAVSKWPSREEQLRLLVGQILGPGARLAGQIKGPGSRLASQIKKLGESDEEAAPEGGEAPAQA